MNILRWTVGSAIGERGFRNRFGSTYVRGKRSDANAKINEWYILKRNVRRNNFENGSDSILLTNNP